MRFFFLIGCVLFANTLTTASPKPLATIKRIVETREGRKSCWGVVIQLRKLSFNKSVARNELSIIEAKHNHEMTDIMTWSVDKTRKKLTVKFKKGSGDFGSGNMVEVKIKSSAIAGSQKENINLLISTDI
jgi:hypothetical protein